MTGVTAKIMDTHSRCCGYLASVKRMPLSNLDLGEYIYTWMKMVNDASACTHTRRYEDTLRVAGQSSEAKKKENIINSKRLVNVWLCFLQLDEAGYRMYDLRIEMGFALRNGDVWYCDVHYDSGVNNRLAESLTEIL